MTAPPPPATQAGAGQAGRAGVALVIFDFDGVIADSEVISLSSLGETLAEFGLPLPPEELRRRYLGRASDSVLSDLRAVCPPDRAARFLETWQARLFARFRTELVAMAGLGTLLGALETRGLPWCIASSGSFRRLGVALGALRLGERFAHVYSAEQVRRGKPAPDLFLHAAADLGISPARCLVIEDSPYGIRAARAAGMRAAGFLGGAHLAGIAADHRALLQEAGADPVLETLEAVIPLLDAPGP